MAICQIVNSHEVYNTPPMKKYILVPTGSLVESYDTIVNGIQYTIGQTDKNAYTFIYTADSNAEICDLRIGDTINAVIDEKFCIQGWGCYKPLCNDWYAGVTKIGTDPIIINFFFQSSNKL